MTDSHERLHGSNTYHLRVPANVPTSQFWAVDVYDAVTGAFIRESPVVGLDSYEQDWTIQSVDAFSTVIHQIGSASRTPGGKFLMVGPDWKGEKPEGFIDILRVPTNYAGAFGRSFAARTPEAKARAVAVVNQLGMYPLSKNPAGRHNFDAEAVAKNKFYPPGVTAELLAADPDVARPEWVVPTRFWEDLETVLAANPTVGPDDDAMADQARSLVVLYDSSPAWKALRARQLAAGATRPVCADRAGACADAAASRRRIQAPKRPACRMKHANKRNPAVRAVKGRAPSVEDYAFKGGYPTPNTVQRAYDEADLNRAVLAYRFFYGPEQTAFDGSWRPGDFIVYRSDGEASQRPLPRGRWRAPPLFREPPETYPAIDSLRVERASA